LSNPAQAQKMLEDIENLDFNALYVSYDCINGSAFIDVDLNSSWLQSQLQVVTNCDRVLFKRIESMFKDRLAEQFTLETLADWLQFVCC
jgi:hypothetical protein